MAAKGRVHTSMDRVCVCVRRYVEPVSARSLASFVREAKLVLGHSYLQVESET